MTPTRLITRAIRRPGLIVPPFCRPVLLRLSGQRFSATESHRQITTTATTANSQKKEVRLTAESYPSIERDARFAKLTSEDVAHFRSICPVLSAESDDLEAFNTDWMRKYRGQTRLVLKPKSTANVSEILKYCNSRSLAVVPQGGNTGLVGGSVPIYDEIVVSMNSMSNIRSFDPVSGILICDAGVVLETADNYLAGQGHIFPLDLGAKGSCHVAGNVATNAGGLRLLRYGSLHGTVLGVEAVLPDGTIMNDLSTLRKNNTGYDLKQLFIGSEGTLGIITAVSIICPPRPNVQNVAFFGVNTFEKVLEAFIRAKRELGEILSAFELMDGTSQRCVAQVTGKTRPLAGEETKFYVLVETSGSNKEHDDDKIDKFLMALIEDETIVNGVLAQDETQQRNLWSWREGIPEVLGHWGGVYKYDVSIPLKELYSLVEDVKARLIEHGLLGEDKTVVDVVGFGHMGDGNLHLNIPVRSYDSRVEQILEPFVYEWIQKRKGSISAEHGLGVAKREYVQYSRGETELGIMRSLKNHFDPVWPAPVPIRASCC
ncbi:unnamed protein product [Tuber aestivum]|uniref:FAD-binding PCMH-type domain-containing protein n=1 Tax=Tuber aestivum TaxID=59557 RepID=A0A292PJZ7_9PEZI|nr:unnamed protein product [Tuber aestivum]